MEKTTKSKSKKRNRMFLFSAYFFLSCITLNAQTESKIKGDQKNTPIAEMALKDHLKQQWITAHPGEYVKQGGVILTNERVSAQQKNITTDDGQASRKEVYYPMPHIKGFPAYLNTGNEISDIENYRLKKDKWISENQELYNSLNQVYTPVNNQIK